MSNQKLNKETVFQFLSFISMKHAQYGANWWPRVQRGAGDAKLGSAEEALAAEMNINLQLLQPSISKTEVNANLQLLQPTSISKKKIISTLTSMMAACRKKCKPRKRL